MQRFENKVVIITGGAGSIGTAQLLLDQGARVMLVDNEQSALVRAVQELDSLEVDFCVADVSKHSKFSST
jgi:NADP-dependent 3-hydroxy acid dehydrogenase YdfG